MAKSGIVTDNFETTIRVQDDLFGHVNGRWLADFVIPADRASDGAFRELHDQAEAQTRAIIESQGPDSLIGAAYRSFMDEDRVEALSVSPLEAELLPIAAAGSPEGLARIMGGLSRAGVGDALGLYVDTDPGDPQRYVLNLHQAGIGLPDEAYYREEQHGEIRLAYRQHIAKMFSLLIDASPEYAQLPGLAAAPDEVARRVFGVEKRLAAAHWDVVKDRDATATYNPMTFASLQVLAPGFAWDEWASGIVGPAAVAVNWDALVVMEPSYLEALGGAWRQVPLVDWQLWAYWRVINARSAFLNAALVEESFDFYGRTLNGTEQLRERWKRGVSWVSSALGELIGQVYVERHFPAGHKARMEQLVGDLIEAYRQSIQGLDWLGEETKLRALEKLEAFTPKIGYPDKWRDYSHWRLRVDDLIGNVRAASNYETDRELAKLSGPVDRSEWLMTPQTVNAYYNPGMNEIVFPAAILQPPFFDADADDAANYGGIGGVIGHEIGHGFDDQGSKYDGSGRLVDWWTEADRGAFDKRTQALIAQYDAFELDLPEGARHVNGALTVGENIGDLGGLAIAWKAYLIALGRSGLAEGPTLEDMTAAQRFFFGWAQCWRQKSRPQQEAMLLAVDPHSPPRFRCNGVVMNLDVFYSAFGVEPTDGLYLDPQSRVTIW
jgi:putative endopeptidase